MTKKNIFVAREGLPGSLRAAYFSSIFYVQDKNVPTKVLKVLLSIFVSIRHTMLLKRKLEVE